MTVEVVGRTCGCVGGEGDRSAGWSKPSDELLEVPSDEPLAPPVARGTAVKKLATGRCQEGVG